MDTESTFFRLPPGLDGPPLLKSLKEAVKDTVINEWFTRDEGKKAKKIL